MNYIISSNCQMIISGACIHLNDEWIMSLFSYVVKCSGLKINHGKKIIVIRFEMCNIVNNAYANLVCHISSRIGLQLFVGIQ